jgi:hypothetical protein
MLRGLLAELEAKYQQLKNAPLKDDKLGQLKKEVEADLTNLESKFKLAQLYTEKELLEEGPPNFCWRYPPNLTIDCKG